MIHILEPHGDDAMISCWPIINKPVNDVHIVTFGRSRNSSKLKNHFPSIRETTYLDCYEIDFKFRVSYRDDAFLEVNKGRGYSWQWQRDWNSDQLKDLWIESYEETALAFRHYIQTNCHRSDLVLAPIGVIHPYHVCHAAVVLDYMDRFDWVKFGFYVEYPYSAAKWAERLIKSHPYASGKENFVSCSFNQPEWEMLRKRVLLDVYPSENYLLRKPKNEFLDPKYTFFIPDERISII